MARKLIVGLLTLLVIAQGLIPVALAAGEQRARVTVDSLNLRSGSGTSHAVVRSLARDTVVTVIETRGDWSQVRLADGTAGWVAAKYIAPVPEESGDGSTMRAPGAGDRRAAPATAAMTARGETRGGSSTLGAVAKWGCLLGAVAAGGLGYAAHSSGNDAYDEYKQLYTQGDFDSAEAKYRDATDKDDQAQIYFIAGGVLAGLWALQQFVLGGGDDTGANAGLDPMESPVTWDPLTDSVRATLVRW